MLSASTTLLWLGAIDSVMAQHFPSMAALTVQVQDAQGRPVDGVPVTFQVDPTWERETTLFPLQTQTRGGMARATFEVRTTGIVQVTARVENTTAVLPFTVMTYRFSSQ